MAESARRIAIPHLGGIAARFQQSSLEQGGSQQRSACRGDRHELAQLGVPVLYRLRSAAQIMPCGRYLPRNTVAPGLGMKAHCASENLDVLRLCTPPS